MTNSPAIEMDSASNELDQELADLLAFSVWELKVAANRAFAPMDLSTFQIYILNFIAADPQIRLGDLAKRLGVFNSSISTSVAKLIKLGLLKRATPKGDRRERTVSLTKTGERIREEANSLWKTSMADRYANMSQEDKKTFLQGLRIVHSKHTVTIP